MVRATDFRPPGFFARSKAISPARRTPGGRLRMSALGWRFGLHEYGRRPCGPQGARPTRCAPSVSNPASPGTPKAPASRASATRMYCARRPWKTVCPPSCGTPGRDRGWVTAEYGMLPRSTHSRTDPRGGARAAVGSHLKSSASFGRSLRAVTRPRRFRRTASARRLRCPPGRRRHAHRGDHGRSGRPLARLRFPRSRGAHRRGSACRPGGRGFVRPVARDPGRRPGLCGGFGRGGGREFRPHRVGPACGDAGDRRRRAVRPRHTRRPPRPRHGGLRAFSPTFSARRSTRRWRARDAAKSA